MSLATQQKEFFDTATGPMPEGRMRVYAEMFLYRQVDALRADFPAVASLLGDHDFFHLAEAYLALHPSTHHSLSQLGHALAGFCAEAELSRPDVADLAALEWARCAVFEEAHAAPVGPEILAGDAPSLRLRFAPAFRLLLLRHDVSDLWRDLEDALAPRGPLAGPCPIAVWRKDFVVFHIALGPAEASALTSALAGAPLAQVCEAFPDSDAALAAIGSWFAEGWLI
jgi:hypothetical protein